MSAALLQRVRRGENLGDIPLIDIHGHIGRYSFAIPGGTTAGMVAAMDRIGVAKIVCSHMRCLSRDTAWGNAELLRATRDHPGRILGYVALWPADPDEVRAETETYLGAGFVGLKLHNCNGFPYDHPAYDPAYERANARQMPALYHSWGGDKELEEIRKVSNRFPNLSLLLAHAGAANEENYARIARECPNVYLELALSRSPRGLVKRLVDAVGADRVVWGSDMYFLDQAQQIGKVAGAQISEEDKIKILSGNAQRILGRIV